VEMSMRRRGRRKRRIRKKRRGNTVEWRGA